MILKFILFAKECKKNRPSTPIQEDGAPSHAHHHQATVYALHDVARLLWPGNSPDLNVIEPCWWWIKRRTTARGAPQPHKGMERAWLSAWEELSQSQIQEWIERIPVYIKEIIRLERGNEYTEGR
jgi:transposase